MTLSKTDWLLIWSIFLLAADVFLGFYNLMHGNLWLGGLNWFSAGVIYAAMCLRRRMLK